MRCAWFWLVAVVVTAIVNLALLFAALLLRRGRAIHRISAFWGRAILRAAGTRLAVEGAEHASHGPYMIVANHSSMMDIPAGFAALPPDFRYVSRPFFFRVPLLGWSMAVAGHVALDPKDARDAARSLRGLDAVFAQGRSVLMYPEGTRSPDGEIRPYRRGPFLAAIRNGVPILPVRLVHLHERLPRGRLCPVPGPGRVIIGPPVPTAGLHPPDARRLADDAEAWTRSAAG